MHVIPRSLIGASATIAATALVMIDQGHAQTGTKGYDPPSYSDGKVHFEKKENSFGNFIVVRSVEDYRAAPILHGPWLTIEARISWRDSTDTVGFDIVDDGASVRLTPMGKSPDHQTTCIMQKALIGYDPKPSTLDSWKILQSFIYRQLRDCSAIAPDDLSRAIAEMQSSGGDYVSAANAWKQVSLELFGPGRPRCIAERVEKPVTDFPRYKCTKYSVP